MALSAHRQALFALLFLNTKAVEVQLPWMAEIGRPASKPAAPPTLRHGFATHLLQGGRAKPPYFSLLATTLAPIHPAICAHFISSISYDARSKPMQVIRIHYRMSQET